MNSRFLIITGMSGAGKSLVLRTLEDLEYLCIDNLPDAFVGKLAALSSEGRGRNVAIVVDIRAGRSFNELIALVDEFQKRGQPYDMLFLDAEDDVLVRRFKETRRRHPLSDMGGTLLENIRTERELLEPLRRRASRMLDTSRLAVFALKEMIAGLYDMRGEGERMNIKVQSFGFKYGLPVDSDLVLDVRFLPNPFYVPDLRGLSGHDRPVADYISAREETGKFLTMQEQMLDFLLPYYIREGKVQLVISVGCTGGRHRSVFVADKLADYLVQAGYKAEAVHRDVDK